MAIGFPTIMIPATKGGDARDASKHEFQFTIDQVSWLSMSTSYFMRFHYSNYDKKIIMSRELLFGY